MNAHDLIQQMETTSNEKLVSAFLAVRIIQDDAARELDIEEPVNLEFRSDGSDCWIVFAGTTIWQSFEDDRKFIDDVDDWEPMLPYIRKRICEVARSVGRVRIWEDDATQVSNQEVKDLLDAMEKDPPF